LSIRDNRLVREFLSYDLDPDDYVIAGSGPLLAHGMRAQISDLDVIARGAAWERAVALGERRRPPFGDVSAVYLLDGAVEVLDGWFPERWSVDRLIDGADVIEGIRFLPLRLTLEWKTLLGREKDRADIAALERRLV
jgi:hypothetical protein